MEENNKFINEISFKEVIGLLKTYIDSKLHDADKLTKRIVETYNEKINGLEDLIDGKVLNAYTNVDNKVSGVNDLIDGKVQDAETSMLNAANQYINEIKETINEHITKPWVGSKEEYDNIETKDPNRFYFINYK